MRRTTWIVIVILAITVSQVSSKMLLIRLVESINTHKISIYNKFKFNQVFLSNQTRSFINNNNRFQDVSTIPSVEVLYRGMNPQKYYQINSDTHAYILRYALTKEEIVSFINTSNQSKRQQIVMLSKEYEKDVQSLNHTFCFYQSNNLEMEEFKHILQECISNEQQSSPNYQSQNIKEELNNTLPILIILLVFSGLTALKLLYFSTISKPNSVI